ncbi:MAG: DNA repair protein RecN [Bacteroidales bacterium]|jgi:DNA repair protein RecN (Recombination protein N)
MLVKLYVRNYALIKDLDVQFEEGLTIITGETGAGKTILLGAMSLILGSRADTSVLLEKDEKCVVEGTFRIDNYELAEFFASNELDYEPVTILRREINPAGKSRAFINDTPVTINLLKELGDRLIDIHSQHQTLMLHDNMFQLNVIDSFAGTSKLKDEYMLAYLNFRKLEREFSELKEKAERNKADLEYYQFQLVQLEDARLNEGEQEDLEKEQDMLNHAEEIKLGLSSAYNNFSSDTSSVLILLKEARNSLSKISGFLAHGDELIRRTDSAYIELNDVAGEIEKLIATVDADPHRLAQVNDRLDTLYSLIQKHRVGNVSELIRKREEVRSLVKTIVTGDERMTDLEGLLKKENQTLENLAGGISGKRKNVVPDVEKKISDMLKQLGMPNARFRISLTRQKNFTPSGYDHADFLFSANKQVEPEDLAKIASGGELSRVMLSLKSLLTKNTNLPTIIFDEIDSGVSGEVADKVGQILAGMGKYMQVINITHLPQVASRGTKHYHVYKDDTGNSTITRIKLLSENERIIELARLLSGSEITETAIKNARELLKSAKN